MATTVRPFRAPASLPGSVLIQAEALWNAATEDGDDRLADLLGLGPIDGHDGLTRCDVPDCGAWFWADEGATVRYESGRELTACDEHAIADDPGARVFPGIGLLTTWMAERDAEISHRIRTAGRA